jgi:hypothetical protein
VAARATGRRVERTRMAFILVALVAKEISKTPYKEETL